MLGIPLVLAVRAYVRSNRSRGLARDVRTVLRRRSENVGESSLLAIALVRRIVAWTESLAARDIAIARLGIHWAGFGTWWLNLQSGIRFDEWGRSEPQAPDIVSVGWDGFESSFRVELSGPTQKQRIVERKVPSKDDPIAVAQACLEAALDADPPAEPVLGSIKSALRPSATLESRSAAMAIDAVRRLAAFAEQLAELDVAVGDMEMEWSAGRWSLDLRNGTDYDRGVVRAQWSGRDRMLSIAVSPVERGRGPSAFKTEYSQTLGETDDPIVVAREYLASSMREDPGAD